MNPGKKSEFHERLRSVERQYLLAGIVIEALEQVVGAEADLLARTGMNHAELRALKRNLSDTYFVRLFAESEVALRDYWRNGLGQTKQTRTVDLIDSVAARRNITENLKLNVIAVKEWRNHIVHGREVPPAPVELSAARRSLNHFVSFLPEHW